MPSFSLAAKSDKRNLKVAPSTGKLMQIMEKLGASIGKLTRPIVKLKARIGKLPPPLHNQQKKAFDQFPDRTPF